VLRQLLTPTFGKPMAHGAWPTDVRCVKDGLVGGQKAGCVNVWQLAGKINELESNVTFSVRALNIDIMQQDSYIFCFRLRK